MKEQIEEMAFDLCRIDTCKHLPQEECNKTTCAHCEAEALYNAGYRKQKEGEWKLVDKAEFIYQRYKCSVCGYSSFFNEYGELYQFCPNCGSEMKGGAE